MPCDTKLDMEKVTSALLLRMPECKGPWHEEKTKHGQSNPTYILQGKAVSLVLRRKPDGVLLRSAHMVEREYRVMKALRDTPVPVPKVFYLCQDPTEIGNIYFIMEHVKGITFSEPSAPTLSMEERRLVYDNMNAGLVALHKVSPVSVGLSDFGKPGNYFKRQLSTWSRQLESSMTESIAEMELLNNWLLNNVPPEVSSSCIVHGDWRIDNLIFSKSDFSLEAILDWELSTLGDPRADLAAQVMQWSMPLGAEGRGLSGANRKALGIPEDEEYIDLYSKRLGLSHPPDLEFAIAFSFFRMAAILQGIKKRALDGNASNPEKGLKMGKYVKIFAKSALDYLKI